MNYQDLLYVMEIVDDALVNFSLLKQKDEPLYKYVRKFKTANEIVESHLGRPIIFSKYVKKNDLNDENDIQIKQEWNDKVWEKFVAYKFLKNANRTKYGHMITHLKERKSIEKDEFPGTLTLAINTLSNQYFRNDKNNKQNKNENKTDWTLSKNIQKESPDEQEEDPRFLFTNIEYKCYCCGETSCPHSAHTRTK